MRSIAPGWLLTLALLAALLGGPGMALALPERVTLVGVDLEEDGSVVLHRRECSIGDGARVWLLPECDDGYGERVLDANEPLAGRQKTYYNYGFYGAEVDAGERTVTVYRMWCSGFGGVANQPEPTQDCSRSWTVVRVAPADLLP